MIRRIGMMKVWKPIRAGYQYNNLMFVTAGEAAASAAKMPWEQMIKTRIFAPLGMTESRIAFADCNCFRVAFREGAAWSSSPGTNVLGVAQQALLAATSRLGLSGLASHLGEIRGILDDDAPSIVAPSTDARPASTL